MPTNQILCSVTNEPVTISEANNIHKHYDNLVAITNNGEELNHIDSSQLDDISLAWYIYRIKSNDGEQVRKKFIQKFFINESLKLIGHIIKFIGGWILAVAGFTLSTMLYPLIPTILPLLLFSFSVYLLFKSTRIIQDIYSFITAHLQNYSQSKKLKELEPLTFTHVINECEPFISSDMRHANFLYQVDIRDPNLQKIGGFLFGNSTKLTQVTIPNSVTHIDDFTFYDCTNLTRIDIPNSVTHIGESAFRGCTNLTQITIPNSVTHIDNYAFYKCSGLTHITIPNSVKSISEGAFATCTGLTHVTIPDSVESIGLGALAGCTGLTHVTIPNSVTNIAKRAFFRCTGLTQVTIPNSLTNIAELAFAVCTGLTQITIPNSVTSIAKHAFADCTGLTHVTIPNSVKSIDPDAFEPCRSLEVIAIEDKDDKEYRRLVRLLPQAQQRLARPWSELKAAVTIKQQALMPMVALSMRGLTACLILKLSFKTSENFLSVWTQLPRYLNMFENSHAWPCRESLFSQNCTPIPAPGFATMFHQINKKMAFHLNPAVAHIPLPKRKEEFATLFTRVTETARPYIRGILLKPVKTGRAPENSWYESSSDEDIQVASL